MKAQFLAGFFLSAVFWEDSYNHMVNQLNRLIWVQLVCKERGRKEQDSLCGGESQATMGFFVCMFRRAYFYDLFLGMQELVFLCFCLCLFYL